MKRQTSGFTVVDLLVLLCILALFIPMACIGTCRSNETANRVKCASNLKTIGQAIQLYANENKKSLPLCGYNPGVSTCTWGTGSANVSTANPFAAETKPSDNDVTAALYLLLRTQDVTSEVFVCPSSNNERIDFDTTNAQWYVNWYTNRIGKSGTIALNLSYSFQNGYASQTAFSGGFRWKLDSFSGDNGIAADLSPGTNTTGAGSSALPLGTLTATSAGLQQRGGNSVNHDRDGQNVLYGDGHVEFQNTSFCGLDKDNIYFNRTAPAATPATSVGGSSNGSPFNDNDTVLANTNP